MAYFSIPTDQLLAWDDNANSVLHGPFSRNAQTSWIFLVLWSSINERCEFKASSGNKGIIRFCNRINIIFTFKYRLKLLFLLDQKPDGEGGYWSSTLQFLLSRSSPPQFLQVLAFLSFGLAAVSKKNILANEIRVKFLKNLTCCRFISKFYWKFGFACKVIDSISIQINFGR